MKQQSFSSLEQAHKKKQTKREIFLGEMDAVVPWSRLIAASPSTKNEADKRDPDMSQPKKGNQWYFNMKAHIGVDAKSGLIHSKNHHGQGA